MTLADLHEPILPILRRLLADAALPRTGCVLDLACGDAEKWPLYREELGPDVALIGLDRDRHALHATTTSSAAVEWQNAQVDSGHSGLIIGDAHQIPFASVVFDGALCIAALGLFADPQRVLAELQRVLRPGAPALLLTAERRWAQVLRWPAALATRLAEAAAHTTLPLAHPDLIGDLESMLLRGGFANVAGRAFLIEAHLAPVADELALVPWATVRPLLAAHLSTDDLWACDAIEPEIELCSIAMVCVGYREPAI